jgi:integrase
MTSPHSTKKAPAKPTRDFPLYPHPCGQWVKKIRGRVHYFGQWSDPDGALKAYLEVRDDLLAGRTPRPRRDDELTVLRLCDLFLESRERLLQTSEISPETFADYKVVGKLILAAFGRTTLVEQLTPQDFAEFRAKLGEGTALVTLENRIARVRAFFNHADKNGWLERSLSRIWGTEFKKPSRKALRVAKANSPREISAQEIWRLLDVASPQLAAMIWLGINCGFGPTDLGHLRLSNLDLEAGWVSLPRSKTGAPRRCPLWPETIKALKAAIHARPTPKSPEDADLVFVTKYGRPFSPKANLTDKGTKSNGSPVSSEFQKLRKLAGITGRGKGLYSLRHMLQTIGDGTKNFVAVSALMGHVDQSISGHYRERIADESLREVTSHVRKWLLAGKPGKPKTKKGVSR